jgi:short-subunit dehydrogenase
LIKKIAITGASGFVGKAVSKHFVEMGDEIVSIGRDDFTLEKLVEKLEGVEVIINLAGSQKME